MTWPQFCMAEIILNDLFSNRKNSSYVAEIDKKEQDTTVVEHYPTMLSRIHKMFHFYMTACTQPAQTMPAAWLAGELY